MIAQAEGTGPVIAVARGEGPVLSLEHISKTYPGTRALIDVSFDLQAGEVHCLIGENGAGKSTLMKILAGVVRPDAGSIKISGNPHDHLTPGSALALGVSTIYQDADIVTSLTVAENIFLGREVTGRGIIDSGHQRRTVREFVSDLGVPLDPDRLGSELSPAERQLTMIVRALSTEPSVLVLDEPTASLGQSETEHLLALVRRLAERGLGIIYISHYLEEVLEIGDRVTVLKDGRWVATQPAAESTPDGLVKLMVGRDASAFFTKETVEIGEVRLRAEGLTGHGIAEPASFEVRGGEVLGFGGLVGAGRTELMELVFGIRRARAGQLTIDGATIPPPHSPSQAVAAGIACVTEDRATGGLFPDRSVRENVASAWNELRGQIVQGETRLARGLVERLSVVTPSIEQEVMNLSGGNQQKVVIGRWLAIEAKIYIFDEPTKGVDVGAKHDIYGFIADLLRDGRAVIIVSSDLPELLSISDRIAVMRAGRIVGSVDARQATEESLMQEFLGV